MATQPLNSAEVSAVHNLGPKPIVEEAIVVSTPAQLALQRDPEEVLREASKAAKALKGLIEAKPKKVVINGQTFLQYEDWLTVARFYGVSPAARATNYIERGRAQGYECYAEAILVSTGQVIGAAQAECLDDEARWNMRPVYEWRNGQRIKVGEEKVPLFQLRSMAQTRAESKVLASVLRWVVVLAGYSGTPAEEMMDGANGANGAANSRSASPQMPYTPMHPDKVRQGCFAIAESASYEAIHAAFRAAYSEASKLNDRQAQSAFIAAKDDRLKELRRKAAGR